MQVRLNHAPYQLCPSVGAGMALHLTAGDGFPVDQDFIAVVGYRGQAGDVLNFHN